MRAPWRTMWLWTYQEYQRTARRDHCTHCAIVRSRRRHHSAHGNATGSARGEIGTLKSANLPRVPARAWYDNGRKAARSNHPYPPSKNEKQKCSASSRQPRGARRIQYLSIQGESSAAIFLPAGLGRVAAEGLLLSIANDSDAARVDAIANEKLLR